jgi:hypothetical protein
MWHLFTSSLAGFHPNALAWPIPLKRDPPQGAKDVLPNAAVRSLVREKFAYIGNRTKSPTTEHTVITGGHGILLKFMVVNSVRIGGLRVRAVAGGMYKSVKCMRVVSGF